MESRITQLIHRKTLFTLEQTASVHIYTHTHTPPHTSRARTIHNCYRMYTSHKITHKLYRLLVDVQ